MKWNVLWALLLCCSISLRGAFDYPASGVRGAALHGSAIAARMAADGFWLNPALAADAFSLQAGLWYSRLYGINELPHGGGYLHLPRGKTTFGVALEYLGNPLYQESNAVITVARNWSPEFSAGISAHYYSIEVQHYGSSATVGFDAGFRYMLSERLLVAGSISNFNRPKLNGRGEELPQVVRIGWAWYPITTVGTFLTIRKDSWWNPELLLGISCEPLPGLAIYSGLPLDNSRLSAGMRLRLGDLHLDYSLQQHGELGATHYVGLSIIN